MDARAVEVRTVSIELNGGRRLSLSRFTDPATGRDLLTLAEGWPGDAPMPGARGEALELPGAVVPELVEALEALAGEGDEP